MRPLSAADCISPAIARTKLILFTPFRPGRSWKLCATSYLCRIGTMFLPFPLIYLAFLPLVHRFGAWAITLLVGGALILTVIFVVIFYLCSRLQFAFFDIVVNRGEFVAPAWRKYGRQSQAWTWIKVLAGSVVTLACAAPIMAVIRHFLPLLQQLPTITPGQPPPPQLMSAIFAFYAGYGVILLAFGVLYLISSLLSDFIVPSLALEDTGLGEAFRRMGELIRREPGEFAIYTLIKIGLAFVGYMGAAILWEIAAGIATLILLAVFGGLGFLLHLAGVPSVILIVLAILLGIAWYLFIFIYSMMFAMGPVFTFLDAYALFFLGGRYPMLGDLLDRSTPPPAPASPAAYPTPPSFQPTIPAPPPPNS